jgi:hypothetical protein
VRLLRAAAALGLLLVAGAVQAQALIEPEGAPEAGGVLTDREFGVDTRQFGLDRRVEMYQWRRGDEDYEKVWNAAPIDSTGFEPGHENPKRVPLENLRWWADKPTLDAQPLDADVLRSLGEWRVLHPNFSRLPANLAASFQPEGDGLGSADNPLEPEIGDLRVTWRELVLPPLAGKVALRDGVWRRVSIPNEIDPNPAESAPLREQGRTQRLWPVFGGGLVVIVALVVAMRRKRERRKAKGEA